ncbi:hypothetical protein P175DRAFT_0556866 [Aspergillus ochraceoroseus IBT 24754]|uniref:Uncharacterized protein n=1 Tax=Aspergillus ochraceoroseus IBT 24754 TaxID=1392256 RepID=A0A2T5M056_9EURO|nr:uncharacterized protein P175DRAFT_0556866 [Aspergillus ochraceoroseus IBT 24754]PTU21915.1 hypothetical protein P175DRAFT_0556866 [Aspergillus ochraceoroseus IBT 24754]
MGGGKRRGGRKDDERMRTTTQGEVVLFSSHHPSAAECHQENPKQQIPPPERLSSLLPFLLSSILLYHSQSLADTVKYHFYLYPHSCLWHRVLRITIGQHQNSRRFLLIRTLPLSTGTAACRELEMISLQISPRRLHIKSNPGVPQLMRRHLSVAYPARQDDCFYVDQEMEYFLFIYPAIPGENFEIQDNSLTNTPDDDFAKCQRQRPSFHRGRILPYQAIRHSLPATWNGGLLRVLVTAVKTDIGEAKAGKSRSEMKLI